MTSIDDISRDLRAQAVFLKDREPVYERLLALFEEAVLGEFGARLIGLWSGRTFHSSYERPLLLLAALRYDALYEGDTHPLHAALAEDVVQVEAVTLAAFAAAVSPARTRVEQALRTRAVQTNETIRAVTWLWPAHLLSTVGERRPIALVDLGTSAGLNLIADERLARLEQAIEAFKATVDVPVLEARALDSAAARLNSPPGSMFVLCVQTIVRDYLAPDERERYEHGMREFLLKRPRSACVVELEVDLANAKVSEQSATIVARFATPDGDLEELVLARTHPHPRQLFNNRDAIHAFTAAFRTV